MTGHDPFRCDCPVCADQHAAGHNLSSVQLDEPDGDFATGMIVAVAVVLTFAAILAILITAVELMGSR